MTEKIVDLINLNTVESSRLAIVSAEDSVSYDSLRLIVKTLADILAHTPTDDSHIVAGFTRCKSFST